MDKIWSYIFITSIAQSLFIMILMLKNKKRATSYFLIALLTTLLITNLDVYVISSGAYKYVPHFFNISMGMMFLFGPLFYFYTRQNTDNDFKWQSKYFWHFVPYLLNIALNYKFFTARGELKIFFIESYLGGLLDLRPLDKVLISLQTLHLATYLYFSKLKLKHNDEKKSETSLVIPMPDRKRWLYQVTGGLLIYTIVIAGLLLVVVFTKSLQPWINYTYTLLTSAGIYIIAYKAILYPYIVNPDFQKKYRSSQSLNSDLEKSCLEKLATLMNSEKVYKVPDLKIETLAKQLGISANQLSRLINERFGKSFTDYVSEYRVGEFIRLIDQKEYLSYSLYGLAMEVGFNSKSTFNTSFKKITGKTPSEFKKQAM